MSLIERIANRISHDMDWQWRRLTAAHRALPDFLIIGAQKAGTSSLFSLLGQHPDVLLPCKKEVHYFDGGLQPEIDTYALGPSWYQAHFQKHAKVTGAGRKTFEASPQYLYSPVVAMRIARDLPDVKLIASLRNPIDRAISHYFHEVRMGREDRPIELALDPTSGDHPGLDEPFIYKDPRHINKSYLARGFYAVQLQRFFEHVPADRLMIVESDKITNDPAALKDILAFLELDTTFSQFDTTRKNVNELSKPAPKKLQRRLRAFYSDANRDLFELLGRSLDW